MFPRTLYHLPHNLGARVVGLENAMDTAAQLVYVRAVSEGRPTSGEAGLTIDGVTNFTKGDLVLVIAADPNTVPSNVNVGLWTVSADSDPATAPLTPLCVNHMAVAMEGTKYGGCLFMGAEDGMIQVVQPGTG